jgi:hypothetical protein
LVAFAFGLALAFDLVEVAWVLAVVLAVVLVVFLAEAAFFFGSVFLVGVAFF